MSAHEKVAGDHMQGKCKFNVYFHQFPALWKVVPLYDSMKKLHVF